ncbi:hypothetical protein BVRB_6g140490 [Beta vulgaris subsp. vulgaris]|nr:hypothetical protein BVRB_6g140490 [Beta vulgaris subsp. vulgaris]
MINCGTKAISTMAEWYCFREDGEQEGHCSSVCHWKKVSLSLFSFLFS